MKCRFCDHEMTRVDRCEPEMVEILGTEYKQIHFGFESRFYTHRGLTEEEGKKEYQDRCRQKRCSDCNVAFGQPHHPGCSVESCPRCNKQIISCGCLELE